MGSVKDTLDKLKKWWKGLLKKKEPPKKPSRNQGYRNRRTGSKPSVRKPQNRKPTRKTTQPSNRRTNTSKAKSGNSNTTQKKSPRKTSTRATSPTTKSNTGRRSTPRKSTTTSKNNSGVIRPSSMVSGGGRKRPQSRTPRKKTAPKRSNTPQLGEITHYFSKIKVAVVKLSGMGMKVGDSINVKGDTTDLLQKVDSMQIESVDVKTAKKGQMVGIKLKKPVRVGDKVYKAS